MTYKIKKTTFGELEIGASFKTPFGSQWFKRSTKTAVGRKQGQGPLGRSWDYFPKNTSVIGAIKA